MEGDKVMIGSPLGKTPGVKLVHSFVLSNERMQFNMISHVLTGL